MRARGISYKQQREISKELLADMLIRHVGEVHTQQEIAEYTGLPRNTVQNIEARALGKLRKALLNNDEQRMV